MLARLGAEIVDADDVTLGEQVRLQVATGDAGAAGVLTLMAESAGTRHGGGRAGWDPRLGRHRWRSRPRLPSTDALVLSQPR